MNNSMKTGDTVCITLLAVFAIAGLMTTACTPQREYTENDVPSKVISILVCDDKVIATTDKEIWIHESRYGWTEDNRQYIYIPLRGETCYREVKTHEQN